MVFVGIDLHKTFLVADVQDSMGNSLASRRFDCAAPWRIFEFFEKIAPFQAVIEACGSYRWLHDLLAPLGDVVLAHPLRLKAIAAAPAKTDKLDAALLAQLLRAGLIPEAYVPGEPYRTLRDLTRARARLSRDAARVKIQMREILRRLNIHPPLKKLFGVRGRRWLAALQLDEIDAMVRDELLARLDHYEAHLKTFDEKLEAMLPRCPQAEALLELHGVRTFSALLILAEIGEPERFGDSRQLGAYAGLTARVNQSGGHCYMGRITRQGSPWLRWILVQVAMKLKAKDRQLGNLYQRVRKRSGKKKARVAVARKLAGICWSRLMRWQRRHAA